MALPSSGPLSFSEIAAAVGVVGTPYSLANMSVAAGFSTPPYGVNSFYGYSPPTTVTLDITININNFGTNGNQGDNDSFQIIDVTGGYTEVFYIEYLDEFSGTYTNSITLTVGHQYYYNGYMATPSSFPEYAWHPTNGFSGSPIYTLDEDCYTAYYTYGSNYGFFTVNSGSHGNMSMTGLVDLFDSGTDIDQCFYS